MQGVAVEAWQVPVWWVAARLELQRQAPVLQAPA
jgi:hypothetical protein